MWVLWVRHLGSSTWHKEAQSTDRAELIEKGDKLRRGPSVADYQLQPQDYDPNARRR